MERLGAGHEPLGDAFRRVGIAAAAAVEGRSRIATVELEPE